MTPAATYNTAIVYIRMIFIIRSFLSEAGQSACLLKTVVIFTASEYSKPHDL